MIKEQFVSFETAKMLKEAGFNEHCHDIYDNVNGFRWFKIGESTPKGWVPCPTQALAARWLRETHGIHVSSNIFMDSANDADGKTVDEWTFWSFDLFDNSGRIIEERDDRYDRYEEALEAGLKRGLELIKNK